jgi:hypothetical protein
MREAAAVCLRPLRSHTRRERDYVILEFSKVSSNRFPIARAPERPVRDSPPIMPPPRWDAHRVPFAGSRSSFTDLPAFSRERNLPRSRLAKYTRISSICVVIRDTTYVLSFYTRHQLFVKSVRIAKWNWGISYENQKVKFSGNKKFLIFEQFIV